MEVDIFKGRNHKRCSSIVQYVGYRGTLFDYGTEICTKEEINVQHHHEVRTSKKSRDVSPSVELSIEGVNDEMDIDESHHGVRGSIRFTKRLQYFRHMLSDIPDMNCDRYRPYPR
jgi:hypothetical protein